MNNLRLGEKMNIECLRRMSLIKSSHTLFKFMVVELLHIIRYILKSKFVDLKMIINSRIYPVI